MSLETRIKAALDLLGPDVANFQQRRMLPDGFKQSSINPLMGVNGAALLASGRLHLVRCPVKKGEEYSGISFFSASTTSVPLHQVFALYNPDRTLIGTTANDTNTAWAANTRKRLALSSPWTPTANGWVYVGIAVTATTVPALLGLGTPVQVASMAPAYQGRSSTGVSTPASFPTTAAALTTDTAGVPLVLLD